MQGEQTTANYLTISAIGRVAKQPEFKYCAVRIAPAFDALEAEPAAARVPRSAARTGPGTREKADTV